MKQSRKSTAKKREQLVLQELQKIQKKQDQRHKKTVAELRKHVRECFVYDCLRCNGLEILDPEMVARMRAERKLAGS